MIAPAKRAEIESRLSALVGIPIQAYCAIIACLLIPLWTGGRPNLRTYEMVFFYLTGWSDLDELTAHLEKLTATKKSNRKAKMEWDCAWFEKYFMGS